jgi:hypothetical protein
MKKITQSEFIKGYCRKSGISEERWHELGQYAAPCTCGELDCHGWQASSICSEEKEEEWKQNMVHLLEDCMYGGLLQPVTLEGGVLTLKVQRYRLDSLLEKYGLTLVSEK